MARTSPLAVQGVLLSNYDGSSSLTPFIDSASLITDRVSACSVRKGSPYTSSGLELIERWLAAWAYCLSERPEDQTRTLSAASTFSGKTEMGLDANTFGQFVRTLDPLGCVEAVMSGGRRTAALAWGGKGRCEELPYEDRY
jgi:hypothetical protein